MDSAIEFIAEIISAIYPMIQHGEVKTECNKDAVEISLLDDNSTIWINWGSKYHCKFIDLPIIYMAAIADKLIMNSSSGSEINHDQVD